MSYRNKVQTSYCEICGETNTKLLEVHHIEEQSFSKNKYGKVDNNPYNLICIYVVHHTFLHTGDIIIEKKVRTSNGYEPMWKFKDEDSWRIGKLEY